jgi:hypothetical protein
MFTAETKSKTMRSKILLTVLSLAIILSTACSYGPDHKSPEAFLKSFVTTVQKGGEGQFPSFYLKSMDFDVTAEGGEMALNRFTGTVKQNFMRSCSTLSSVIKGQKIKVEKIDLGKGTQRVVNFLKDVEESYSNIRVHISTESDPVILMVDELVKINGKWRMTTFMVVIDQGSTTLEPKTIEIEKPEEEEDSQEPGEEK